MTVPRPLPEGGFSFTWQPTIEPLDITTKEFLSTRPLIRGAATGAFVFSKATGEDRVLIVQRAPHDTMPLRWEVPGGACDLEDATILHGLARELWEEAGLKLKSITRQIGPEYSFFTSRGLVVTKINFEVEVESPASAGEGQALPEVTLDPNEHVRFLWATEDECRQGRVTVVGDSGEPEIVDVKFTTEDQRRSILYGFKLRREASMGTSLQQ